MKKILFALLAAMTIFSFCACGGSGKTTSLDPADKDTAAETAEGTQEGSGTVASDGSLMPDPNAPRYTSDGELIVEEEIPASDGDLK